MYKYYSLIFGLSLVTLIIFIIANIIGVSNSGHVYSKMDKKNVGILSETILTMLNDWFFQAERVGIY